MKGREEGLAEEKLRVQDRAKFSGLRFGFGWYGGGGRIQRSLVLQRRTIAGSSLYARSIRTRRRPSGSWPRSAARTTRIDAVSRSTSTRARRQTPPCHSRTAITTSLLGDEARIMTTVAGVLSPVKMLRTT